eukprot:6086271-Pleurochrysis_carterae.AAC.1
MLRLLSNIKKSSNSSSANLMPYNTKEGVAEREGTSQGCCRREHGVDATGSLVIVFIAQIVLSLCCLCH